MSTITREDVIRVAELARLELDEAEVSRMTADLARILDHAEALQALDTEGIEPTAHAIPLATPLRSDEPVDGLDPEEALRNAPSREGDAFVVPKMIEDQG
jgi:aspartyl-tRNA(Asn)/glutamyl-tRNA(Gln) amidotransferase subunit C